ncbi:MAG: alanine racemase [Planctomycetota bacterium]
MTEFAEGAIPATKDLVTFGIATALNYLVHVGFEATVRAIKGMRQAAGLTKTLEDLKAKLDGAYYSSDVMSEFRNESPFTGVLGTLYFRAERGTRMIRNVSKETYLQLLANALQNCTHSYKTVHRRGGFDWFREDLPFLLNFRDKKLDVKLRVLVASGQTQITDSQNDEGALCAYGHAVGVDMQTAWITVHELEKLSKQIDLPTSVRNADLDVVICDDKLVFTYDEDNKVLYFEHFDDKHPSAYEKFFEEIIANPHKYPLLRKPLSRPLISSGLVGAKGMMIKPHRLVANAHAIAGRGNCGINSMLAILKSDAYGLGIENVFQPLYGAGVRWFGVSTMDEGELVKRVHMQIAGPAANTGGPEDIRILLVEGARDDEMSEVIRLGLEPFVWSATQIQQLATSAKGLGRSCRVHLKIDTGMRFIGVEAPESDGAPCPPLTDLCEAIARCGPEVRVAGFANQLRDGGDADFSRMQDEKFCEAIRFVRRAINLQEHVAEENERDDLVVHARNSAAALSGVSLASAGLYREIVRSGGALFGGKPGTELPVVVVGTILRVVEIGEETPVGYVAVGPIIEPSVPPGRYAVVNVGYGDGLPASVVSNPESRAVVNGVMVPYVSTIRMNYCMLRLDAQGDAESSKLDEVVAGMEVTILGKASDHGTILLADFARWAAISPYNVLCQLGRSMSKSLAR